MICEERREGEKRKNKKLTVLICLAFSGAPIIVLLRHARIANIARVFDERTSVPEGRSLSKYKISSRSTSPMNQPAIVSQYRVTTYLTGGGKMNCPYLERQTLCSCSLVALTASAGAPLVDPLPARLQIHSAAAPPYFPAPRVRPQLSIPGRVAYSIRQQISMPFSGLNKASYPRE